MTQPAQRLLTATRNVPLVWEWWFASGSTPLDMTGWTGRMQVRLYEGQPDAAKLTLNNVTGNVEGIWLRESAAGRVQGRIDEATLAGLPVGAISGTASMADFISFSFDAVFTDPTGFEQRLVAGILKISSGVTF